MSIFAKLLSFTIFTVVSLVIALLLVGYQLITNFGDESARGQLMTFSDSMQADVNSALEVQQTMAELLEKNDTLQRAIAKNDATTVQNIAKNLVEMPNIDLVTICDMSGKVIARGHADKAGDIIDTSRACVNVPLQEGKRIVGMEQGSMVPLILASGTPLFYQDKQVGVAVLGINMSSGTFVENIKKTLGVESTIFLDDKRIATTIRRDGKPIIGTSLNNSTIYDEVMRKGSRVITHNIIGGEAYDTIYWPWKDMRGEIAGMFFVGLSRNTIVASQHNIIKHFVWTSAISGLIIIALGTYIARTLSIPLRKTTRFAEEVAAGNFNSSLAIRSKDEVGILAGSLQKMLDNLKSKIMESEQASHEAASQAQKATQAMNEAHAARSLAENNRQALLCTAENVEQVVARLSDAAKDLTYQIESATHSAEIQREQVANSAMAIEEMNSTVLEVASSVSVVSKGAEQAKNDAQEGSAIVYESVNAINMVRGETHDLRDTMRHLGRQAESIGDIMIIINDIADQTNLLALNAAIEAARAGEAGRGFAVVADEVRKLAEKTMNATKDVGEAIGGIQENTRVSILAVDRTSQQLENTSELVNRSGESLSQIVEGSIQIADQVRSIATATEQQSATSEEISHSLSEIHKLALDTASMMQHSNQTVSQLMSLVQMLERLVQNLRGN